MNDLLSMMSSLRTSVNNRGDRVITSRRDECVGYFVDGMRWTDIGESPDMFISGHELGAVEVYDGFAAPGEFRVTGRQGEQCTSIVIWTKWKLRI